MGDLIRSPHSEINAFVEYLDSIGVSSAHLKSLRISPPSANSRKVVANVLNHDLMTWSGLYFAYGLRELGVCPAHLDSALKNHELMQGVRQLLLGHASIQIIEHLIDLNADPFIPEGWQVEEHQKGTKFKWDASQVQLWLANSQQNGKWIEGNKLRKELSGKPVLNANVLDYLLAHPHLIPEEWKGKYIFFWGTIYRESGGRLFVRCLFWFGGRWQWGARWQGGGWSGGYPAALPAS